MAERDDGRGFWSRVFGGRSLEERAEARARTAKRTATHVMMRMRAPLIVSLIAVAAFAFSGQVYEIYRLLAEDFRWSRGFECDQLRFVSFLVMLYFACFALWYIARVLTLTDEASRHALTERGWAGSAARWGPRLIGAAPAFAAATGMARAEYLRDGVNTPGLYVAALVAFMIGVLRIFTTWRRARRTPSMYEDLTRTAFRMDLRLVAALAIVAGVGALMLQPIGATQALGTLTIFCFFLIALVFLYAQVTYLYDKYAIPVMAILVGGLVLFSGFDLNDNHFLRERQPAADEARTRLAAQEAAKAFGPPIPITIESSFKEWYAARADRDAYRAAGKPYPVYVVAAQGGGVYAAYQAAVYLAALQDRCPSFATHLFGISGVSGGSVGAAVYTSLATTFAENRAIANIAEACEREGARDRLARRAHRMLSQDFLTPLISAMLFPDFTARFSPVPIPAFDRARGLERALEHSWEAAFTGPRLAPEDGTTPANPLQSGLISYWRPDGAVPALFLNTTEAETGRRLVLSPIPDLGGDVRSYQLAARPRPDGLTPDLRLSTAAMASARFPYFTPAASMALRDFEDLDGSFPKLRLVDGGYFENSGVDTAMSVVDAIERAANEIDDPIDVRLIVFDLTRDRFRDATYAFGELLSPIKTILNATVARSTLAQTRARRALDAPCRYVLLGGTPIPGASEHDPNAKLCPPSEVAASRVWSVSLNDYEYDFQLGWILSRETLRRVRDQLGDPRRCAPAETAALPGVLSGAAPRAVAAEEAAAESAAGTETAGLLESRRERRRERWRRRLQRLADDAVARHNGCIARFIAQNLGARSALGD